jgi:cation diffusion facilitator CzcD-associated flavoprotein CzcO
VAVVGAGASAVESAALVQEAGGEALLLARCRELEFHTKFDPTRSLWQRFKDPNSVLGPGRKSWVLQQFPWILHYLPEHRRVRFTRGYLGPAGPWWLRERFFGKIAVETQTSVVSASEKGGKASLELRQEGTPASKTMEFDHVIAGTGFEVDVDRLTFMAADLRLRVRRVERAPALDRHFESSVQGLYFVGPSAAFSFGPLFRFVTGAAFAAPTVTRHILSRR